MSPTNKNKHTTATVDPVNVVYSVTRDPVTGEEIVTMGNNAQGPVPHESLAIIPNMQKGAESKQYLPVTVILPNDQVTGTIEYKTSAFDGDPNSKMTLQRMTKKVNGVEQEIGIHATKTTRIDSDSYKQVGYIKSESGSEYYYEVLFRLDATGKPYTTGYPDGIRYYNAFAVPGGLDAQTPAHHMKHFGTTGVGGTKFPPDTGLTSDAEKAAILQTGRALAIEVKSKFGVLGIAPAQIDHEITPEKFQQSVDALAVKTGLKQKPPESPTAPLPTPSQPNNQGHVKG